MRDEVLLTHHIAPDSGRPQSESQASSPKVVRLLRSKVPDDARPEVVLLAAPQPSDGQVSPAGRSGKSGMRRHEQIVDDKKRVLTGAGQSLVSLSEDLDERSGDPLEEFDVAHGQGDHFGFLKREMRSVRQKVRRVDDRRARVTGVDDWQQRQRDERIFLLHEAVVIGLGHVSRTVGRGRGRRVIVLRDLEHEPFVLAERVLNELQNGLRLGSCEHDFAVAIHADHTREPELLDVAPTLQRPRHIDGNLRAPQQKREQQRLVPPQAVELVGVGDTVENEVLLDAEELLVMISSGCGICGIDEVVVGNRKRLRWISPWRWSCLKG